MCKYGVYKYLINTHKIIHVMNKKFVVEKPEMINKTFRLPLELVEKMQTLAQNKGVSLNKLVLLCCEYALDNLEK